jgi:membrane protease YdiL (CAAX protease family)
VNNRLVRRVCHRTVPTAITRYQSDQWPVAVYGVIALVGAALVLAQLVMGLILSWFWRRTGNLAMPATVHAVIDAVLNGFLT